MLTNVAHFVIVAYSTFPHPSLLSPRIMSLPVEMPPMPDTFVACVLEQKGGSSAPRAAIIFKADVSFDCPQMPHFILRVIDSIDVIRKLSRRGDARGGAAPVVVWYTPA